MWMGDPGLMYRLLGLVGDNCIRTEGLAPGRYWLHAFPDSFVFEPESFDVSQESASAIVTWRMR